MKILTVNLFLPWQAFLKLQGLLEFSAMSRKSLKHYSKMQSVISEKHSLAVIEAVATEKC